MESMKLLHSNGYAALMRRPLNQVISAMFVVAVVAPTAPPAHAQSTGAVPATCAINTSGTGLSCTLAINLSGVTGAFANGALTLSAGAPAPQAAPNCNAITPSSQVAVLNATNLVALSANCPNATSYQWYSGASIAGGTLIPGATGAVYSPPTTALGTIAYQVQATNGVGTTDNVSSATVTINASPPPSPPPPPPPPPPTSCPAGEPRISPAFTASTNFVYQSIVGSGASSVFVAKITLGANDTTTNKNILPSFLFQQDDTTVFSDRTVTVSQTCNDFSPSARVIMSGQLGGSMSFVTTGDPRASASVATLSPGVWYINVRNDTCPQFTNCSISGIWRNWNK
jgi:hypothetical protein